LPLFTGTSSETLRKVPDRIQIDTTSNRQNRIQNHTFIGRHRSLNRTAVISEQHNFISDSHRMCANRRLNGRCGAKIEAK
jgi:hypothetical protein